MEALKAFICDMLTTLGLGIGGNVYSYNSDKAKDLFKGYTITLQNNIVSFSKDGKHFFDVYYDTNDKGTIKRFEIKE